MPKQPHIKIEIELPTILHEKLMKDSADLHRSPSLMITEMLLEKTGLVGIPIGHNMAWGKPATQKEK